MKAPYRKGVSFLAPFPWPAGKTMQSLEKRPWLGVGVQGTLESPGDRQEAVTP